METDVRKVVPLGFSDLNQDELLLVSIFRIWYRQKQNLDAIESSILLRLREDKIYPALKDVFVFFRSFIYRRLVLVHDNELLSHTEEFLLEILGGTEEYDNFESQKCREKLMAAMTLPRPMEYIERSGYDLVQYKVAQSYCKFIAFPV